MTAPDWHALEPPAPLTRESLLMVIEIYQHLNDPPLVRWPPTVWINPVDTFKLQELLTGGDDIQPLIIPTLPYRHWAVSGPFGVVYSAYNGGK